jgi:hypothetical protein
MRSRGAPPFVETGLASRLSAKKVVRRVSRARASRERTVPVRHPKKVGSFAVRHSFETNQKDDLAASFRQAGDGTIEFP